MGDKTNNENERAGLQDMIVFGGVPPYPSMNLEMEPSLGDNARIEPRSMLSSDPEIGLPYLMGFFYLFRLPMGLYSPLMQYVNTIRGIKGGLNVLLHQEYC